MEPASPVGLAENKGLLYYLEQNTKSIFSISKSPPYKIEEYLENTANHLRALTVFHHERERLGTLRHDSLKVACIAFVRVLLSHAE